MVDKIHGGISTGENVGKNMDFFTLYTIAALATGDVNTAIPTAKDNLERLIQFIQTRSQAVMVGFSSAAVLLAALPAAPYFFGADVDANATVYTLKFAVEHADAWVDTASAVNNLSDALDGLPMPFTTVYAGTSGNVTALDTTDVDNKNTTIVKSLTL